MKPLSIGIGFSDTGDAEKAAKNMLKTWQENLQN